MPGRVTWGCPVGDTDALRGCSSATGKMLLLVGQRPCSTREPTAVRPARWADVRRPAWEAALWRDRLVGAGPGGASRWGGGHCDLQKTWGPWPYRT